jgi:hypothetical protein
MAREAGPSREGLYPTLSGKGTPSWPPSPRCWPRWAAAGGHSHCRELRADCWLASDGRGAAVTLRLTLCLVRLSTRGPTQRREQAHCHQSDRPWSILPRRTELGPMLPRRSPAAPMCRRYFSR